MANKHDIHATAKVVWKSQEELGRLLPPPDTTRWAATARFIEDDEHNLFSVVLYYSVNQVGREADLHFLAPELVLPRMKMGSRLYITDGPKIVAEAIITEVMG
jgi:hypothetical protein